MPGKFRWVLEIWYWNLTQALQKPMVKSVESTEPAGKHNLGKGMRHREIVSGTC